MYQMTSLLKAKTMISSIFLKKRKVKLKMKWTWKNNLIQQKSLAALVEVKCKTRLKKELSEEEVWLVYKEWILWTLAKQRGRVRLIKRSNYLGKETTNQKILLNYTFYLKPNFIKLELNKKMEHPCLFFLKAPLLLVNMFVHKLLLMEKTINPKTKNRLNLFNLKNHAYYI